jgi:hypothetical protein
MSPARDLPPRGELPDPDGGEPESVGSAKMEKDGTLKLYFRTETAQGMVGEALTVVKPGDKDYESIRKHLAGIQPGKGMPIPPFPPPEIDPDSI